MVNQYSLQLFSLQHFYMNDRKFLAGLGKRIRRLHFKKKYDSNPLVMLCGFQKKYVGNAWGKANIIVIT